MCNLVNTPCGTYDFVKLFVPTCCIIPTIKTAFQLGKLEGRDHENTFKMQNTIIIYCIQL